MNTPLFSTEPSPVMLNTRQAAAVLGVHERTVRRYLAAGLLAHRRLPGGHYRIPARAIEQLWSVGPAQAEPAARDRSAARRPQSTDRAVPVVYDLSPAALSALRSSVAGAAPPQR
jgi:excisionase family DNA binding protein